MNRILQLLSLSRRAGKLALGYDAVEDAARSGKAALILISSDSAERTRRNMLRIGGETGVRTEEAPISSEEWSRLIGKASVVLAVLDSHFAEGILRLLCPEE